jgi:hypothetical protein
MLITAKLFDPCSLKWPRSRFAREAEKIAIQALSGSNTWIEHHACVIGLAG